MNRKHPPSPAHRSALKWTLTLALPFLSAGTAHAGFTTVAAPIGVYDRSFVTSTASAGAPGTGANARYDCNAGSFGGAISDLRGCGGYGGRPPGTGIESGTADSTGRTTAVTALAQANDFHTVYDSNNQPIYVVDPSFSRAQASASLADAGLHLSVANNPASGGYVGGHAEATLHDRLTFRVAGADASTTTRVQFQFSIDGSVSNDGRTTIYGEPGSGTLVSYFSLDNRQSGAFGSPEYSLLAGATWENFRGDFTMPATGMVDDRGSLAEGVWTTLDIGSMVFDGYFDIIGAEAEINPTLLMSLDCSLGLQCDYGNTAKLRFTNLPSSVSFTSDSGVFMSALTPPPPPDPGAVPEPASLALAGVGFLAACWTRRRRPA